MMFLHFNAGASLLILFAASTLAATPVDQSAQATLKRQAEQWDQAIIRKDRQGIEKNIASDFMQIGSDGKVAGKSAFVTALMDERLTISPYSVQNFQIRIYGDTALLTGTTDMRGHWDGKPFSSHYRYTDVYIRENGKWRVVNVQITPLQQPRN